MTTGPSADSQALGRPPGGGAIAGTRCLARPAGAWEPGKIQSVLPDGTYVVELDHKPISFMKYWHGVTAAEVSLDDAAAWPPVFDRIISDRSGLSRQDLQRTFARLGIDVDDARMESFWNDTCDALWKVDPRAAIATRLDPPRAYAMIVRAGLSARQLADEILRGAAPRQFMPFYWNQTRMGGRDPSEIGRTITMDDTLDALGLGDGDDEPRLLAEMLHFAKKQDIVIPPDLARLMCRRGSADAVWSAHPNAPELVGPGTPWQLRTDIERRGLEGELGLTIMTPHQGEHVWVAVFDRTDRDARVYLHWTEGNEQRWQLQAPTLALFFWDLAQTGLSWLVANGNPNGRTIQAGPFGLVMRQ